MIYNQFPLKKFPISRDGGGLDSVENLPSKREALNSNPKKRKKKEKFLILSNCLIHQ
jgi:hypothetical protein